MNTCAMCKHKGRNVQRIVAFAKHAGAQNTLGPSTYYWCERISNRFINEDDPGGKAFLATERGQLVVEDDFGCALWEAVD